MLRDRIPTTRTELDLELWEKAMGIVTIAADAFGVDPLEVLSPDRHKPISRARQLAAHLLRSRLNLSLPAIADVLNRDHSTIVDSLTRYRTLFISDDDFRARAILAGDQAGPVVRGRIVWIPFTEGNLEALQAAILTTLKEGHSRALLRLRPGAIVHVDRGHRIFTRRLEAGNRIFGVLCSEPNEGTPPMTDTLPSTVIANAAKPCGRSGCDDPIVWATSRSTGKATPVNAAPDPNVGNIVLVVEHGKPIAVTLSTTNAANERSAGRPLYLNHFATCKNPPERTR